MAAPIRTSSLIANNDASIPELSFQDFTFDSADKTGAPGNYSRYPDDNISDTAHLLEGQKPESRAGPSFWEFQYYQQFFDVDTNQVLYRIFWSMVPRPGLVTFLHRCVQPTPDLYGPFWICATLVFAIAIGGNMSDYLHTAGRAKLEWKYDFHKVSLAATTIYSYAFLIPLALYAFLWYRRSQANYSLMDLVCLYGYSLAIYVPISILCVIQIWWLQLLLIVIGTALSGSVLLLTLWPAVKEDQKKIAWISLVLVLFFHSLMAFGFLVYFFAGSSIPAEIVIAPTAHHSGNDTIQEMKS